MFKKLAEFTPMVWGTLALLLLGGIGLTVLSRSRRKWTTRMLAMAALCVALSFVLSYVRVYRMPQGGSITPASMLPLLAFSYFFGPGPGLLAGLAHGLLEMLQGATMLNPIQVLLDYPIAFGSLAIAGLFRKYNEPKGLLLGIAAGSFARFLCSVLSGAVFFYEYAGDMNPWLYSIGYNGSYMLPEAIICLVIASIPAVRTALSRLSSIR